MLGFSPLATSTIADDGALTTLVSTDIVSLHPSVSNTTVAHIYNLATVQIETDYTYVSTSDVTPNIVLESSSIVTTAPMISNPSYIINCVFEYSNITTSSPSVTQPDLAFVYNLSAEQIAPTNIYMGAVDVVPNVLLTSIGFSLGSPTLTSVDYTINVVTTPISITIDTPVVSVPLHHIKGPFNPNYAIKRTYVLLSESRVIQIPGVARNTIYHATPDNRNMRIQ